MRNIGLFGGTFDPIHRGHLGLAKYILDEYELDEIWFIPTGFSHFKADKKVTEGIIRYSMLSLSLQDLNEARFKVLDLEIKREGPSYTVDTLLTLKKEFPGDSFYLLIGEDNLFSIEKWYHADQILKQATLIVAKRNFILADDTFLRTTEEQKYFLEQHFGANICISAFPGYNISSSEIRDLVYKNISIKEYVTDSCVAFINEKGLYIDG